MIAIWRERLHYLVLLAYLPIWMLLRRLGRTRNGR